MYTILGKPDCPWCDKAIELLIENGKDYDYVDVTADKWITSLLVKAGQTTVPLIFGPDSKPIGGYAELLEGFK